MHIHQFYLINFDLTCEANQLKDDLNKIQAGCKATFIIDACYGGGFPELNQNKIVVYAASKSTEEAVGGDLGSVFCNAFTEFIMADPGVHNIELITQIQARLKDNGALQTPMLVCTLEKETTSIFE